MPAQSYLDAAAALDWLQDANTNAGACWIAANGSISHRAREKIFERYKTQKIRFLPISNLVDLAEKYAPDFGTGLNIKDSSFLTKQRENSERRQLQSSLLPSISQNLYVDPSIIEVERNEYGRRQKKENVCKYTR